SGLLQFVNTSTGAAASEPVTLSGITSTRRARSPLRESAALPPARPPNLGRTRGHRSSTWAW
ncbi:MAG: hypothetical protein M3163_10055, partial [Actinomycetota bacterium]|nr:hypothetical protein [Actinomycetota bacterium]